MHKKRDTVRHENRLQKKNPVSFTFKKYRTTLRDEVLLFFCSYFWIFIINAFTRDSLHHFPCRRRKTGFLFTSDVIETLVLIEFSVK